MKSFSLTIISLLISLTVFCEVPNTFKYQAVIRNADGETLANKDVTINLIILKDGASTIYSEEHNATTNSFGLVNLEVGSVNESKFANIDWSAGSFQLAIEMDGELISTTDILAVPYANCAATALSCDYDSLTNRPIILSGTNTAVGHAALNSNSSGEKNTACGYQALYNNESGSLNNAFGYQALYNNTDGYSNAAFGNSSLLNNTTGKYNSAFGYNSMYSNTSGLYNTSIGYMALFANNQASYNVAIGYQSLYANTDGERNTTSGYRSMFHNTKGSYNTANGFFSLVENISGECNTACGYIALQYNTTGSYNTAIGYGAGTRSGDTALTNITAIGYGAKVSSDNSIVLGNNSITSIGGYASWSDLSDGRFKTNVQEEVPGLDFITLLRPVTFNWDIHKLDEFKGVPDSIYANDPAMEEARLAKEAKTKTGFIAQEVEAAADSIGYDFSGVVKPANDKTEYRLSYSEFVVPLVKAVQEQQAIIEDLKKRIEELEALQAE